MREGCRIEHKVSIDTIYTFFRNDFKKDYVFSGERHNFWEIVFVMEGSVGVKADDGIYELQKGQAICHKPDEFHKIWSKEDTNPTVIVLSFDGRCFEDTANRILELDTGAMQRLVRLYELSFDCFERNGIEIKSTKKDSPGLGELFRLEAERFLYDLFCSSPFVEGPSKSSAAFKKAVKYMDEAIADGLCIDDIATYCGISRAYLKKIFVRYSGMSVIKYYNNKKAKIACACLSKGMSVKDTSAALGFCDQNYFSTFFKKHTGKSPAKYKKEIEQSFYTDV